jgi:NADH:flavin oxidoreductases, Old Yellow Enzyme family
MAQLENLFKPVRIGKEEVKNRIMMLATSTGFAEADSSVSERLISFYAERAKGGVGLITVPFSPINGRKCKLCTFFIPRAFHTGGT